MDQESASSQATPMHAGQSYNGKNKTVRLRLKKHLIHVLCQTLDHED